MGTYEHLPPCQLVNALWGMHLRRVRQEKLMLMLAWLRLRAKVVTCWVNDRIRIGDFLETLDLVRGLSPNSLCVRDRRLLRAFMARAEALARYARHAR